MDIVQPGLGQINIFRLKDVGKTPLLREFHNLEIREINDYDERVVQSDCQPVMVASIPKIRIDETNNLELLILSVMINAIYESGRRKK